MIDFISSWAQGLVVAVIIATIIEMLLPEGNSKKFIKIVIGVFVLFQIISPVVQALGSTDMQDFGSIFSLEKYQNQLAEYENQSSMLATTNEKTTRDIYLSNVKIDMMSKLEEKGYIVHNIVIETKKEDSYTIEIISLTLEKVKEEQQEEAIAQNVISVNTIEEIQIQIGESKEQEEKEEDYKKLTSSQKKEVREFLSENYGVKEKNITIE